MRSKGATKSRRTIGLAASVASGLVVGGATSVLGIGGIWLLVVVGVVGLILVLVATPWALAPRTAGEPLHQARPPVAASPGPGHAWTNPAPMWIDGELRAPPAASTADPSVAFVGWTATEYRRPMPASDDADWDRQILAGQPSPSPA